MLRLRRNDLRIIGEAQAKGILMKSFARHGLLALGIGLMIAGGTVSVVAQQDDKTAAIKTRQDFMKAQGADAKAISDYSKGQGDQAAALTAANDLVARAPKIEALFVPGTSATDFPGKTNAKPELWTDKDKVEGIIKAMEVEQTKLVDAVKSGDKQAAGDQLAAVNKAGCGACHGPYRIKTS
jgi:cytochrome c556